MDQKGNCSQCDREISKKNLVPIVDDLVRNKTLFRKQFENINPKFCKTCKNRWLELGKMKRDKADEFIQKMTSLRRDGSTKGDNVKSDDKDLAVPGPSGIQKNASCVTPVLSSNEEVDNVDIETGKICESVTNSSPSTSGNSGSEIEVKKNYNDNIKNFIDAKKERDFWHQQWIQGMCSDRVGDAFDAEMDVYAKNWKRSEMKMKEFTQEYYNHIQNINK